MKIEGSAPAESVIIVNAFPGIVVGKATVLSRYPANWQNITSTPNNSGQIGFWNVRIAGQHDSARRAFGPVAVRFPNLVNQDPIAWAKGLVGDATVTPGVPAPDGTNRAARLSTTLSGRQDRIIFSSYRKFNVGDFVIAGLWVRAASNNGFLIDAPAQVDISNSNFRFNNRMVLSAPLKGDGEWEWISVFGKLIQVDAADNSMDTISFTLHADSSHPHDFYAPMLLHIPTGSISDNEAAELAKHLSSWPNGVAPGSVALLQGQQFVFPPDTNLYRSGTQTLKTDGKLIAEKGLGVGNINRTTALGTGTIGMIEIFDSNGLSMGVIPIYNNPLTAKGPESFSRSQMREMRFSTAKSLVKRTDLMQNYPNPFNPETWIPYQLASAAEVRIRIFDIKGRMVRSLNLGAQDAGSYLTKDRAAYWDGKNEAGESVSSGIYLYEFSAGNFHAVKKMIILK